MKNTELEFKKYMEPVLDVENKFDDLSKNIKFKAPNKAESNILFPVLLTGFSAVTIAIGSFILFPPPPKAHAIVEIDVNPSIRLIVNDRDTVTSISGKNDDGKMIIADEELVGKDLDTVIESIINEETETGYLLEGTTGSNENTITITVSAETYTIKNELGKRIYDKVNSVCSRLNVSAYTLLNEDDIYTEMQLEQTIQEYDSTLSLEELQKMNFSQLLEYLNDIFIESSDLWTVELEHLYFELKNNRLLFAESEYVQSAIETVDTAYKTFLEQYSALVDQLEVYSNDLAQLRYDMLVNPESDYQKQLKAVNDAKDELFALKVRLMEEGETNIEENVLYKTQVSILETLNNVLTTFGTTADNLITGAKDLVDGAISLLRALELTFPSELKSFLNTTVHLLEEAVDIAKTVFLQTFEDTYGADVVRVKEEVIKRKENLKKILAL